MRKFIAFLIGIVLVFTPVQAQAAPKDICTPNVVVGGLITVRGTCVNTPELPAPLPPVPTVPPIVVPVNPIVIPPIRVPPIVVPTPKPTHHNPATPRTTRNAPQPQPQSTKHAVKKHKEKKPQRKIVARQNTGRTAAEKAEARRELAFWFVATMAGVGLAYLIFYRKKDPDDLKSDPPTLTG